MSQGPTSDVAQPTGTEQVGVASLHDTEAEAGDEQEIADEFSLDQREARELGVDLDEPDSPEAGLR